jgi:hypothetical protein
MEQPVRQGKTATSAAATSPPGTWPSPSSPPRHGTSLRNPVVSTTIVGATTIEELQADLGALTVQLDAEVVERLDRIWPGPEEAPQAYAW